MSFVLSSRSMSTEFDFKEAARTLMSRIFGGPAGAPVNKELIRTAIEVALRDAYNKGLGEKKQAPAVRAQTKLVKADSTADCNHQWQETFLDGRAVGVQCARCGVLEKDIKSRCEHFFVKTGSQEVCVACRATRRARD